MPQDEYNKKFEVEDPYSRRLKSAFAQVSDIRKFEIGLYWTRATYFWALIAVTFAGYFAIFSAQKFSGQYLLSMLVGTGGFVFTFAWYLANRGSKYWQENWENHLDLLEDNITGPLYKTILQRNREFDTATDKYITGPLAISVSKVNQWVSVYVMFIWVFLIGLATYKSLSILNIHIKEALIIASHIIILFGMLTCCVLMRQYGKTYSGQHNPQLLERKTRISGKAEQ